MSGGSGGPAPGGAPMSGGPGGPVPGGAPAGGKLGARRLLPLLGRSFFLQASWSFERMQSVGFAAALAGEGRRLTPRDAAAFLRRHLGYFNTNPVLASFLLGGVVRLEEEVAAGRLPPEAVDRFKRGLAGPAAAWGDTFFWATLRPAAIAVGVLLAWLAGAWGALAYLAVYNVPHLYYRARGLSEGYRRGTDVAGWLLRSPIRTLPDGIRRVGLAALGALIVLGLGPTAAAVGAAGLTATLLLAGVAGVVMSRRHGQGHWWGLAAVGCGLAWALLAPGR